MSKVEATLFETGAEFSLLRALFDLAVAVADPMQVVEQYLPERPQGRVVVIGAGKASARMAEAVEAAWGPCEGLVITRYGYGRPTKGIEIVEAAHPVSDHAGHAASLRMLDLVSDLGADDLVLALISGGGSSLLCVPPSPMTLADKQQVHQALLSSGAPIGQMNIVRKHLSCIKGGQLAAAIYPAKLVSLLISDVPGDDPADIASGATVGERSSPKDALQIIDAHQVPVPDVARTVLTQPARVIRPDDRRLSRTDNIVISAPSQSLDAAEKLARNGGLTVRNLGDALEGEARDLGRAHAELALELQRQMRAGDPRLLLLSGGECTVTASAGSNAGNGGPNAEYAMSAALTLDGAEGIHLIACDTDGVDGAAEIAGALVGPSTLRKAAACGASADAALKAHDSHSFFAAISDQVITGPTLTNVNDFRAILITPTSG